MKTIHFEAAIIAARRDFEDWHAGKETDVTDGTYPSLQKAFETLEALEIMAGLIQTEREALSNVSRALFDFAISINEAKNK